MGSKRTSSGCTSMNAMHYLRIGIHRGENEAFKSVHLFSLSHCRTACFVFIPVNDMVFYLMGSGEYDELACECKRGRTALPSLMHGLLLAVPS
eukprot:scaffold215314_cov13-Tisochrysis_lutea.AAC.1